MVEKPFNEWVRARPGMFRLPRQGYPVRADDRPLRWYFGIPQERSFVIIADCRGRREALHQALAGPDGPDASVTEMIRRRVFAQAAHGKSEPN